MPSNGLLIRWSLVRFQPGEPIQISPHLTASASFRKCVIYKNVLSSDRAAPSLDSPRAWGWLWG
jgi:hypothetical protein